MTSVGGALNKSLDCCQHKKTTSTKVRVTKIFFKKLILLNQCRPLNLFSFSLWFPFFSLTDDAASVTCTLRVFVCVCVYMSFFKTKDKFWVKPASEFVVVAPQQQGCHFFLNPNQIGGLNPCFQTVCNSYIQQGASKCSVNSDPRQK